MTLSRPLLVFIFIMLAGNAMAATIKLSSFNTYIKDEHYQIDAVFDIELSDEVLDALTHGIPIQIRAECSVDMIRSWIPNKTINTVTTAYQLLHQPLTEDYLTVNLKTGLRESYDSLYAALTRIGQLNNVSLINHKSLAENERYKGRIRMYLDLDSLPTPLRPQVYFSKNWEIRSDWHEWVIKE